MLWLYNHTEDYQDRVYKICPEACDLRAYLNYLIFFIRFLKLQRPKASVPKAQIGKHYSELYPEGKCVNREVKRQVCKYVMKPCSSVSDLIEEREFSTGMLQPGRS